MNQDDQELARLRAAFTAPAAVAPDPESCPAPEVIWAAVRGELPPQELREVVEHTASCAACAEDWRLAAELERQSAASAATTTAPGKVITGRFGQWRSFTAAAALAAGLLVAVGVYRTGDLGPKEPTYREAPEAPGSVVRSQLADGQVLTRQGAVLRWSPVTGAAAYDVRVSTEDLRVLQTVQGLTATEYRVPDSALASLPAGSKLLWQVEAVFSDGHRQASPTFTNPLQ
ncbi:MAG TPA: zf-HC2 domain-containing protein [Thermoanaerobaculia bacterium]|nr:zf-HC2 domain-containing protein [Thermoanaerobaculia bacterium]